MSLNKVLYIGAVVALFVFALFIFSGNDNGLNSNDPNIEHASLLETSQPIIDKRTEDNTTESLTNDYTPAFNSGSLAKTNIYDIKMTPPISAPFLSSIPFPRNFAALSDKNLDSVIAYYNSYKYFSRQKIEATWALGVIGGEQAESLLIESMNEVILHDKEFENGLSGYLCHLGALGVLSNSSDKSYNYMMRLTERDGWKDINGKYHGDMRGRTLAYLGAAVNRPKVDSLLKYWVDNIDKPDAPSPSDIVDAHFYRYLVNEHGPAIFVNIISSSIHNSQTAFRFWIKTESGRKWHEWNDSIEGK
jgi:hypothetical protein